VARPTPEDNPLLVWPIDNQLPKAVLYSWTRIVQPLAERLILSTLRYQLSADPQNDYKLRAGARGFARKINGWWHWTISYGRLAMWVGLSREGAKRAVKQLAKKGFLVKHNLGSCVALRLDRVRVLQAVAALPRDEDQEDAE